MKFASMIPGTEQWKRNARKRIGALLKERISTFHGLQSLVDELKQALLPQFRTAEKMFQEIMVWQQKSGAFLTFLLFALCVVGAYFYIGKHASTSISFLKWLEILFGIFMAILFFLFYSFFVYAIIWGPLLCIVHFAPRRIKYYFVTSALERIAWIGTLLLTFYMIMHSHGSSSPAIDQSSDIIAPAYYGTDIIIILAFLYLKDTIARPMKWFIRKAIYAYYPEAILVDHSLEILCMVERRYYQSKVDILDKELANRIDRLAASIERNLAKRLQSGYRETCQWAATSAAEIANSIRESKQYLLLPSSESIGQLTSYFSRFFTAIVANNYSQIERKSCNPSLKLSPWPIRGLKLVLICILPLVFVFLEMKYDLFGISQGSEENLKLAVLLWLISNIAFLFDPTVEKIGSLKVGVNSMKFNYLLHILILDSVLNFKKLLNITWWREI